MHHRKILDDAIAFAAERWLQWSTDGSCPSNLNLRDRIAFFGPIFRKEAVARYPSLALAGDQVLLLALAEGIARSGSDPRQRIETALGIVLPPP